MPLAVPAGSRVFVDANIFYYALVPTADVSIHCQSFLNRAIVGEIQLATSTQVLADVMHKVLTSEAAQITGRDRSGMVGYLKRHPTVISQCVKWPTALDQITRVPMTLLPTDVALLKEAIAISQTVGLLVNDAIVIALMQRHQITDLATNDDDFDRANGITVWKPRI